MSRRRRLNPRLVKIHRNYTVEEAARLLGTHKNTIRTWIKQGLPAIDRQRPTLIHGLDLSEYLAKRRKRVRQTCPPDHVFCVKCRVPKIPAGNMADYLPLTPTSGNLRGICPDCDTLIYRRASLAKLDVSAPRLEIAFPQDQPRIRESALPSANCDLGKDGGTDANV